MRKSIFTIIFICGIFLMPQMMRADNASSIVQQLNGYPMISGGTGWLSGTLTNPTTVTIGGTLTGVTTGLALNIDAGVTVKWGATISSTTLNLVLIYITGLGTFEVTSGAITSQGQAIHCNDGSAIIVSGGTVSSTGSEAITGVATSSVTVNGGTVSATSNDAIRSNGAVTVSGTGTVRFTGTAGAAISAVGNVQVSGGTVSAIQGWAIHSGSTVTVSGGLVFAYGDEIIYHY